MSAHVADKHDSAARIASALRLQLPVTAELDCNIVRLLNVYTIDIIFYGSFAPSDSLPSQTCVLLLSLEDCFYGEITFLFFFLMRLMLSCTVHFGCKCQRKFQFVHFYSVSVTEPFQCTQCAGTVQTKTNFHEASEGSSILQGGQVCMLDSHHSLTG